MSQPKLIKLHRSYQHRMIAGVMGGVAEYFGWSPTVTRILFVIISCCSVAQRHARFLPLTRFRQPASL